MPYGAYGLGGPAVDISNQDLLNYRTTGFYKGVNITNAPSTDWHYYIILRHDDYYVQYICFNYWDYSVVYIGHIDAGNWQGWRHVSDNRIWDVSRYVVNNELVNSPQYTELKTSVSNGKSSIASAITDKGVSTSGTDTFATMAANIRNIPNRTNYIEAVRSESGDSWVFQLSSIPNNFVAFDLSVGNITNSARVLTVFSYGNYHYIGTVTRTSVNYAGFNTATSSVTDNPCHVRTDGTIVISNMAAQIMIYW